MSYDKIEGIKFLFKDLYNKDIKEIDDELIEYLLANGYEHNCSANDLKCKNCIYSWLRSKKKEKLFESNFPFKSYESILFFYKSNSQYFDLGTMYKMREDYTLSAIPKTREEAKFYTPELIDYFDNHLKEQLDEGIKHYQNCPILNYDDLIAEFNIKHSLSPIPKEFIRLEKERIQTIIESLKYSMKTSFDREYKSIIKSEEIIYDTDSNEYPTMRFMLRSYTYPIAKYQIFLNSIKDFYPSEIDLDSELKFIENKLRSLILSRLEISNLKLFKQRVNGAILQAIESRITKEQFIEFHGTKSKMKSAEYWLSMSDLTELEKIISQKNNWSFFADDFGNKDTLQLEFKNICNLRNAIRHVRDLTEIVLLKGKASILWFKQQLEGVNHDL